MHFPRLSLLILFCGTQWLFSQVPTEVAMDSTAVENLNEVIISATRTKRQLASVPLPTQLISAKAIAAANSIRLNDILEEQTGLLKVPDFGGVEGLQMQGLDSQYNLILIDGGKNQLNFVNSIINKSDHHDIKVISIVKGSKRVRYGQFPK